MKGLYFIMATLAFAQMLYFLVDDTDLGGGSDGRYLNFKPAAAPFDLDKPRQLYYLVLALLVLVYAFLALLLRLPLGRALAGIKANEQRMSSLGFPVFRYKLAAFVIGGALAGLAGALFAIQGGFVNPGYLSWQQSANVLLMVILGGVGRLLPGLRGRAGVHRPRGGVLVGDQALAAGHGPRHPGAGAVPARRAGRHAVARRGGPWLRRCCRPPGSAVGSAGSPPSPTSPSSSIAASSTRCSVPTAPAS